MWHVLNIQSSRDIVLSHTNWIILQMGEQKVCVSVCFLRFLLGSITLIWDTRHVLISIMNVISSVAVRLMQSLYRLGH